MKAFSFDYERPGTLIEAVRLLGSPEQTVKVIAGGQSLGPMLNLRLAAPELLVDVTRIPELVRVEDHGDAVVLGACVTHSEIEDGKVIDGTGGVMPRIARGIAYRAIRNRGTIGGSLAHGDPSADWITALAALNASVVLFSEQGRRTVPVSKFVIGAFETVLAFDEVVEAVRIPKLSPRAHYGFYKVCRKPGEFAEAIAAVCWEYERAIRRMVIGATGSAPMVIEDFAPLFNIEVPQQVNYSEVETEVRRSLERTALAEDPYALKIHLVAVRRAIQQVSIP